MKNIHSRVAVLAVIGLLVVAPTVLKANDPAARFRGGSYDGFDLDTKIQSATDRTTFQDLMDARNRGGSYDGYSALRVLDARLLGPQGTLIFIR
jgi:hypothetical protein